MWVSGAKTVITKNILGISSATVSKWLAMFRDYIAISLDNDNLVIGGPGIEVQIDESKFGKRKYNKGHPIEGVLVFGGVEKTKERKYFWK